MQSREELLLKLCADNYPSNQQDILKKIKDLFSGGVNINCRDHQGRTPLHLAVENNTVNAKEIVMLLLNNGANYKARDLFGKLAYESKTKVGGAWNKEAVLVLEFSEMKENEKEKILTENSKNQLEIIVKTLKIVEEQNKLISEMQQEIIQLNKNLQSISPLQVTGQSTLASSSVTRSPVYSSVLSTPATAATISATSNKNVAPPPAPPY